MRCLRLTCPVCGAAPIASRPFRIKHHCNACHALFKREDGFFVGAILANVVTTELAILLVWGLCAVVLGIQSERVLAWLFMIGLIFPIAFYHHSWSFWLGFDHAVETLPKVKESFPKVK